MNNEISQKDRERHHAIKYLNLQYGYRLTPKTTPAKVAKILVHNNGYWIHGKKIDNKLGRKLIKMFYENTFDEHLKLNPKYTFVGRQGVKDIRREIRLQNAK